MNLKDPLGNPLGSLFSHLASVFLPVWLGMHIFAFFSPLWTAKAFTVPDVLNQVALPILAAYGLTRKEQNSKLAQTLAGLLPQPSDQAKIPQEPVG